MRQNPRQKLKQISTLLINQPAGIRVYNPREYKLEGQNDVQFTITLH